MKMATPTTGTHTIRFASPEEIAEGKSRMAQYPDPCEWNPATGELAYADEIHAAAEVIVGHNGKYRLCAACAGLPKFRRYRVRKLIHQQESPQQRDDPATIGKP